MSDIEDYEDLITLAEQQKEDKSKLQGSLEYIVKSLKEKGFNSISEAKAALTKKQSERQSKIKQRDLKIAEFKNKYAKYLQRNN